MPTSGRLQALPRPAMLPRPPHYQAAFLAQLELQYLPSFAGQTMRARRAAALSRIVGDAGRRSYYPRCRSLNRTAAGPSSPAGKGSGGKGALGIEDVPATCPPACLSPLSSRKESGPPEGRERSLLPPPAGGTSLVRGRQGQGKSPSRLRRQPPYPGGQGDAPHHIRLHWQLPRREKHMFSISAINRKELHFPLAPLGR